MKSDVIGVIGLGRVGSPLEVSFRKARYGVVVYDRVREIGELARVVAYSDIIFVCVSTPMVRGKKTLTYVREVLFRCDAMKFSGVIVLKSRITPTELVALEKEFPSLNIVFAPVTTGKHVLCGPRKFVQLVRPILLDAFPEYVIEEFSYLPIGEGA